MKANLSKRRVRYSAITPFKIERYNMFKESEQTIMEMKTGSNG